MEYLSNILKGAVENEEEAIVMLNELSVDRSQKAEFISQCLPIINTECQTHIGKTAVDQLCISILCKTLEEHNFIKKFYQDNIELMEKVQNTILEKCTTDTSDGLYMAKLAANIFIAQFNSTNNILIDILNISAEKGLAQTILLMQRILIEVFYEPIFVERFSTQSFSEIYNQYLGATIHLLKCKKVSIDTQKSCIIFVSTYLERYNEIKDIDNILLDKMDTNDEELFIITIDAFQKYLIRAYRNFQVDIDETNKRRDLICDQLIYMIKKSAQEESDIGKFSLVMDMIRNFARYELGVNQYAFSLDRKMRVPVMPNFFFTDKGTELLEPMLECIFIKIPVKKSGSFFLEQQPDYNIGLRAIGTMVDASMDWSVSDSGSYLIDNVIEKIIEYAECAGQNNIIMALLLISAITPSEFKFHGKYYSHYIEMRQERYIQKITDFFNDNLLEYVTDKLSSNCPLVRQCAVFAFQNIFIFTKSFCLGSIGDYSNYLDNFFESSILYEDIDNHIPLVLTYATAYFYMFKSVSEFRTSSNPLIDEKGFQFIHNVLTNYSNSPECNQENRLFEISLEAICQLIISTGESANGAIDELYTLVIDCIKNPEEKGCPYALTNTSGYKSLMLAKIQSIFSFLKVEGEYLSEQFELAKQVIFENTDCAVEALCLMKTILKQNPLMALNEDEYLCQLIKDCLYITYNSEIISMALDLVRSHVEVSLEYANNEFLNREFKIKNILNLLNEEYRSRAENVALNGINILDSSNKYEFANVISVYFIPPDEREYLSYYVEDKEGFFQAFEFAESIFNEAQMQQTLNELIKDVKDSAENDVSSMLRADDFLKQAIDLKSLILDNDFINIVFSLVNENVLRNLMAALGRLFYGIGSITKEEVDALKNIVTVALGIDYDPESVASMSHLFGAACCALRGGIAACRKSGLDVTVFRDAFVEVSKLGIELIQHRSSGYTIAPSRLAKEDISEFMEMKEEYISALPPGKTKIGFPSVLKLSEIAGTY